MKNLNLPGRAAGVLCILLMVITGSASGRANFIPASAQTPDIAPTIVAPLVEGDQTEWIVLLEGLPVSSFRLQLGGRVDLDETQKNHVRAYSRRLQAAQLQLFQAAGQQGLSLTVRHTFSYLLNGLAVSLPAAELQQLTELPGVLAIYPDRPVHLDLADSVPLIGADLVWQLQDTKNQAIIGQGVRVAVIDTGINYTHPDLGGCFGPGCKVVGGYDLYNNDADPQDDNGHGTHCAGIVAADGNLKGVAPGASLHAYKVLSASGSGSVSLIIAGLELAADPDQDPGTADAVDIISMSLGVPGTPDDPWPLAVDAAVEQGILVAVSAGNSGPAYASVESPGLARRSIAVGAVDKSDLIASFSSRGPIPGYDGWLKPDLLAPGVDIISTYLGSTYATASGTSMAAPHVAGAAALVKQMHPAWTPDQIQASLMNTAVDLGLNVHTQGAGRLQVDQAVLPPGLVTPASVSFGTLDISQPLSSDTRLLWLENVTESVRSYSLSAETMLPDWVNLSIEPASITLLPGEKRSISIVLAVDTLHTSPDLERNEGLIRIQQGEAVLEVPFAFLMPPIFNDSRSLPFALQTSYAVALHDLDGDGDLDAFVGNTSYYDNPANTVWFNDGTGNFTDSGQRLGNSFTWSVALGDLDGDGDPDAFVANSDVSEPQPNEVWLNDGNGSFADSGQRLGAEVSRGAALGDLDGDGDLDAFVANGDPEFGGGEPNTVWLNDGSGAFSDSNQRLGNEVSQDAALGDLDGDGDLDAFVANGDTQRGLGNPNRIWLNNGSGVFTSSDQLLGNSISQAAVLGDLDGDSDLDAFVANGGPDLDAGQPDQVWLNDGSGFFSNSGQTLGNFSSSGAELADFNQDGSLDVFVAGYWGGNHVWLNDGSGQLNPSSPGFGTEHAADVALGDIDADGDVDALVANVIGMPNRLWLNRGYLTAPDLPATPNNLTADAVSPSQVDLTWLDNAEDESAYRVERQRNDEQNWLEIADLPANSTSYTDTLLVCATHYSYRVRAFRASDGQYSAYSSETFAITPPCPNKIFMPGIYGG